MPKTVPNPYLCDFEGCFERKTDPPKLLKSESKVRSSRKGIALAKQALSQLSYTPTAGN
jgi:hypothetical protein